VPGRSGSPRPEQPPPADVAAAALDIYRNVLVERWFAELTTKWIKRNAHRSVRDLVASIRTWITLWNDNPKPYIWHKTADEILDSLAAYCQRINDSGH